MKSRAKAIAKQAVLLVIGLGLIAALVYYGAGDDLASLSDLQPLPVVGAFAATVFIVSMVALRWHALANTVADKPLAARLDFVRYFVISRLVGFVLPKDLSDLVGRAGWLSRDHGIPVAEAGLSVVFDRLLDLLVILVMAAAVLPYWLGWIDIGATLGLMGGLSVAIGLAASLLGKAVLGPGTWLFNWGATRLASLRGKEAPRQLSVDRLDRAVALRIVIFSLAKFWGTGVRNVLFAMALGLDIPSALLIVGTPLGQVTYLFAFTPGGLGVFEAGWVGVLVLGKVDVAVATSFAVAQRVLTLLSLAVLGAATPLLRSRPRAGS